MVRDTVMTKPLKSSFLSCEKDLELILEKLFLRSKPHSDMLKRLLVVNTKDCLEALDNKAYNEKLAEMTLPKLKEQGYIQFAPKLMFHEHEEVKSSIIIGIDNFVPTLNPQFRDCSISFTIICHNDYWDLGNLRMRPLKIAGYIDGILNNCKLTGIGTLQFAGCSQLVLDESLSGYTLIYTATHGSDDRIEGE